MKLRTSRRSRNVVLEMEPRDAGLPPITLPELQLRRILVPVDFSDCSRKVLQYGVSLARQFSAEVLLMHVVVSVPPLPQVPVLESQALDAKYHEQAARELSEWRREAVAHAAVKAVVRRGVSASREIVEAALESNSDLIVIGNHGRTGLARVFLGSTAEQVVRHAPCPVLVIRQREHDFIAGFNAP